MRRLALAITFACVLSGAAHAGEIASTGLVTPPPPPSTITGEIHNTDATAPGEIHSTGAPQESDTVLTIILALIGIVS
jgi:hypothetical protein